jgi:hypothetical protein
MLKNLLPFMLGLGITAGVAPLLFLQLLYQHRFYSANLILGPRWGAVVPALITGFYALYLVKATTRPCSGTRAVTAICWPSQLPRQEVARNLNTQDSRERLR